MCFQIGDKVRSKKGGDNLVVINIKNNEITCSLPNGTTENYSEDQLVKLSDILSRISKQKRPEKKDTKINL